MKSGAWSAAAAFHQVLRLVRPALIALQKLIARSSWATRLYFAIISPLCRHVLDANTAAHIQVLAVGSGVRWPALAFAARSVVVGEATRIKLIPHFLEFDQAVLFRKRLDYEAEVFRWLEREAVDRYDAVIEIGANVGAYSVFFDALIKARRRCRLQTIVSFEPSLEAFRRLLANLEANEATFVQPFRAAVADVSGFRNFFEPRNHLTNGSLIESFAQIFSDDVDRRLVSTHGVADLEFFFGAQQKLLLKLDVEGYEAELLCALQDIIVRYRPDLIIEVLPGTPAEVEAMPWMATYQRYLIAPGGPQRRSKLTADKEYRDWLLQAA